MTKTKLSSSLSVLRQAGLIAPLVFAPALAFGDNFSEPGTTNFVVPPNVFQVTLVAVGGGGHGGFGGVERSGGGGGGGGSCILTDYSVTPGQTLAVTVGAGGTSGNTGAGGGSYVDNGEPSGVQGSTGGWLVRAAGGNGVDTGATGGGPGGAGCVEGATGATGYSGGNGGNGRVSSTAGGAGGGGAAGAGGAGDTGESNTSGTTGAAGGTGGVAGPTGSTSGGAGGQGGTDGSSVPGATGSSPGGGGGGGADDIGSGDNYGTPGNGANGLVQILYTPQQSIAPIPTMGQFGLLTMAGLLGLFVAWRQRRRG